MRQKIIHTFLEKIFDRIQTEQNLAPNEVHVFNVHAAYGHYQIVIRPANPTNEKGKQLRRNLEINGNMHHLFVTKDHVSAHPSHRQIHNNLKGCIIMRDLTVHIQDPTGTGRKLAQVNKKNAVIARDKINLAGLEGDKLLNRMEYTGKLAKEAYKIIQEDILNALVNKQYTTQ